MDGWEWLDEVEVRYETWAPVMNVLQDINVHATCPFTLALELDGCSHWYNFVSLDTAMKGFHIANFGLELQKDLGRFYPSEDRITIVLYFGDIELAIVHG